MRDRVLEADDFERGMYVSVRGVRKQPDPVEAEFGDVMVRLSTSIESAAIGNRPMRIEHVDLPHLVCSCACGQRDCKTRMAVDTRKFELIEISKEFVLAMRPKRWWEFWKR